MEKRRLGRTGHMSSMAIFGTAAFYQINQEDADKTMEYVLDTDINHIDVAPGYGDAEERIGSWLAHHRKRYFLGCKTEKRPKQDAARELRESLEKLQIDKFDLFQLHAVATIAELDQVMAKDGAFQAILDARDEGLTNYIGITSHGWETPKVLLEALRRFDFDTVMFPLNPNFYSNSEYKGNAELLIKQCKTNDIGSMIIKSIARGAWGENEKTYTTWYEPYDSLEEIQRGVNFALSQDITGICTAGDTSLLPMVVEACERFSPMSGENQVEMIDNAKSQMPIFEVD